MMASGPILVAAEVFLNRISYTGQDMVDEIDSIPERNLKRAAYLWRSVMPNAPWIPGAWSIKRLATAMSDETDIFGREYSIGIAATRMFGPKLYPHDVKSQEHMRMMEISRELNLWRQKAWRLQSDYHRNRISKAALDRGMDMVETGIEKLSDRAAKVQDRKQDDSWFDRMMQHVTE